MRNQSIRGFLMIVVAALIIILGLIALATAYMFSGGNRAVADQTKSTLAFYMAESGLERATRALLAPAISFRLTCASITGNPFFTNANFTGAAGVFSITGSTKYNPTSISQTTGANSSATTISATSSIPTGATGYSP